MPTPESAATGRTYRSTRRNRVPLSCDPCRTRKLRCNRERPCQNCLVRDERASCKYKSSKNGTTPLNPKQGDAMQQRIDHLEGLVKRLITQHQQVPLDGVAEPAILAKNSMSDASDSTSSPSKTVIDGVHSVYKGTDDWYDILQEINTLKQVWSQTQDEEPEYNMPITLSNTVDGSSLLFGQVQRIDKTELLSTLPPKPQLDKLIHQFFDRQNFPIAVVPILHQPTFMREYTEHWKDPSRTNVIWLGLLFSILSITMLAYQQYGEPSDYEGMSDSLCQLYRLRTAQSLIMGDIAKCLPYTVEALRLNATAEFNRKDDTSRGLWILTGVMVRAAKNMGYHRDPSQSPSISPFQAEYRRRVWLSVMEMDDMASFTAGFPRMISTIHTDTMEPRNVHDWELSDDLTVLPPPRPISETTYVSYLIVKTRLLRALSRVSDFNNTTGSSSYNEILEIDNSLYEAYEDFPLYMKMDSVKLDCTADGKKADTSILQLRLMYHIGMCQLHRRFIAKGRLDPQYNHSRDRCIASALAILSYQSLIDPSWYRLSRTRKAYTLPAMLLLLELEYRRRSPDMIAVPDSNSLLNALGTSCALWERAKHSCDEADKLHHTLTGMLSSFQASTGSSSSSQPHTPSALFAFPGIGSPLQLNNTLLPEDKDMFDMSNEMNIDWSTWDAFIESGIFENEI
ncbi:hypothetical protein UA08_01696 [Talaromyces atroroseus]|uniref:Zn(2)-C6 fungal-type domain-containing protein n=1 Tax=Talaromyces atroroseus TaxID=1441469 RepID=A0A1Q5QCA3_TALAT|nr:hypothetical protein UA08_01696 [Talaromyces atroroseus]OKL63564.1 hypothetical protein UA08_01696 [Talaromyces atroroseus]